MSRQFWIKGDRVYWNEPANIGKTLHVREVDPAYDAAVEGLVEALKLTQRSIGMIGDSHSERSWETKVNNALAAFEEAQK